MALFFDINMQNGRVDVAGTRAKILADVARLATDMELIAKEEEILKIVAQRRSEASNPQWRADSSRARWPSPPAPEPSIPSTMTSTSNSASGL